MERNEISLHEAKVFRCMEQSPGWMTNKDIAAKVGFSERTVRAHTLRLVKLGILDQAEVFPAHRYKFSAKAAKRNRTFVQRIEQAIDIFGLNSAA